jgi:hypothetical protein
MLPDSHPLGGCHEPVRQGILDQVGSGMQIQLAHDLGLVKLDGSG